MATGSPWEFEVLIHQRLLAGDPIAPSELVVAYLNRLINRVRAVYPNVNDDDLYIDAATDALLSYAENPSSYNPTKSKLLTYLTMSAKGDLLNALAKVKRIQRRETPTQAVEHSPRHRNRLQTENSSVDEEVSRSMASSKAQRLMRKVLEEFSDPRDRQLIQLMLDGERDTSVFGAVLGIEDVDIAQQRKIVKRHKDRIKKRILRYTQRSGVGLDEQ